MSVVLGLAALFVAMGLTVRRFDIGTYLLVGLLAGIVSVMYAIVYFYIWGA